jgi:hypothetical protein
MEKLVPAIAGCHSTVGRATDRGMDKMRAIAVDLENEAKQAAVARKETAERVAAERAAGGKPGAKAATPAPAAAQDDAIPAPKRKPGGAKPGAPEASTEMGRLVRERLALPNPASPIGDGGQVAQAQSPAGVTSMLADGEPLEEPISPSMKRDMAKKSPAFTALGKDAQVYSENARSLLRRYFLEGQQYKKQHGNPEIGHYRVQENLVSKRVLGMEFGARTPHPVRKIQDGGDDSHELGPDDLVAMDFPYQKSGSIYAHPSMFSTVTPPTRMGSGVLSESSCSWKGQSIMTTATERPPLSNIIGQRNTIARKITMNEITTAPNLPEQDRKTSRVTRQPEVNLSTQLGRKGGIPGDGRFTSEVGKYAANHNVVKAEAKKFIGFKHQMSRSAPVLHTKPLGMLDEKGTAHHGDRSLYRFSRTHCARVTHIREMDKDLARPPMYTIPKAAHNTEDPEIDRLVHERAMTYDADTSDRALRRKNLSLNMGRSLCRDRAGHGSRLAQNDIAIRSQQGHACFETTGQLETSVENLKDSCRVRGDLGMSFHQHKARGPTRLKGEYSSLKRPRDHAAPEFSRSATEGFASRTPVKVLPRSRSHDAMPGWSGEAVDGLMSMGES